MRKITSFLVIVGLLALLQVAFPHSGKSFLGFITNAAGVSANSNAAPSLPRNSDKDKLGFPHINYDDAKAAVREDGNGSGLASSATLAATSDFDSDGVPDLITTGADGKITFYKGNADTIYPNSPEAKQRRTEFGEASPFFPAFQVADLPYTPDFLESGDFTADGFSDLLIAARGSGQLTTLRGDGRGNFVAQPAAEVDGSITALAVGDIGRPDGQTDVSVGFSRGGRSFVAVFEHPEGAFSHKPEIFSISQPAASIAIGQFDHDPYADVAVGGGETLTVIHERGQAYPLDMVPDVNIQRPAAAIRSMRLAFTVRSLVSAEMDGTRGDGIAVLGTDAVVRYFKAESNNQPASRPKAKTPMGSSGFTPTGIDPNRLVVSQQQQSPQNEAEADANGLIMANTEDIKSKGLIKVLDEKVQAAAAARAKVSADELAVDDEAKLAQQIERTAERKRLFEAGLAAKPVEFASWKMTTIASDARLASAAASGSGKLVKARVSSSGVDDLLIANTAAQKITVVGRWHEENGEAANFAHIVQLQTNANPTTVIPMRLNSDGRSDLVTLENGSASPSVLMSRPTTVLTVNTANDVGGGNCQNDGQECGLRRAVFWANLIPNSMIAFNIPGSGVHTIHLTAPLDDLKQSMTIDGTTQPGYIDKPLIEIKGDVMAASSAEGFRVTRSNIIIRGFAINQIPGLLYDGSVIGGSGVVMLTYIGRPITSNTIIEANFLGTDPFGTQAAGNDGNGVQIYDADNNLVGGTTAQARNILSGNGNYAQGKTGVGFAITGGNYNRVFNNYVGTDVTGNSKISNSYGAFITGVSNQIGGDQPGMGNVVSGNGTPPDYRGRCGGQGLVVSQLYSVDYAAPLSDSNIIRGNLVGTNASGFAALGNCTTGISSVGNINTLIGSITSEGRNTVSGNKYDGIWCGFNDSAYFPISGSCFIGGNDIGTNITGNAAIPNSGENACEGFCLQTDTIWTPMAGIDFVVIGSPGGNTPNGACTGFCNLISGNYGLSLNGGSILKSGTGFGLIVNNYIGTNRNGDAALPNFSGGIMYYASALFGVTFSDGQGGSISGGNLVSGNYAQGMGMWSVDAGGTYGIIGNTFGLSADGLSALPNGVGGTTSSCINARSNGGTSIAIGGNGNLDRNYVAAEASDGTGTHGDGMSINAANGSIITVFNNWIGLNRVGFPTANSGNGIVAGGDGRTYIGGTGPNESNLVVGNGRAGVVVSQFSSPQSGTLPAKHVTIRGNGIGINGGLGIDLQNAGLGGPDPSGVTPNDCQDFDEGANDLQNFPELFPPVINGDGTVTIPTVLRSLPNRQFVIDYYQSPSADPTTYGEGSNYIGSLTMQTNGNSFSSATFTSPNPVIPSQTTFTATATDENGNTSEFSCAAGVCNQARSFDEAINSAIETPFCVTPIVVNVTGDEPDLDGDNPIQNRDGLCDVDANTPGEQCTLRAAIQEANARPNFDLINFEIPGPGIHTIIVHQTAVLPSIKDTAEINGSSQPGYNGTPLIDVRGEIMNSQATAIGLGIIGSNISVRGLAISQFSIANIVIGNPSLATNNNVIESCFIGIGADGTANTSGQTSIGISLGGSPTAVVTNNRIGSAISGNTIANNSLGIGLTGANVHDNQIIGNRIGTDSNGIAAIPNFSGIATLSGAHHNIIGGTLVAGSANGEGNVISGNLSTGLNLDSNSHHNTVTGNFIGTKFGGTQTLPNGSVGLQILGGSNSNTIGGSALYRNVIAGNNSSGNPASAAEVLIASGASNNTVVGNSICVNTVGDQSFGGVAGIVVAGSNNIIGGSQGSPNIIGCAQIGVVFTTDGVTMTNGNNVSYNRIGVFSNGLTATNQNFGILLQNDTRQTVIDNNLISGNQVAGVYVGMGSQQTTISNNRIGTNADGNSEVPNGAGVLLTKTSNNNVKSNTISGNLIGLFIGDDFSPPANVDVKQIFDLPFLKTAGRPIGSQQFVEYNTVLGNRIGMSSDGQSPIGNKFSGINIGENARNNTIGGDRTAGEGNYIGGQNAQTAVAGIYLGSIFNDVNDARIPQSNTIRGNYVGFGLQYVPMPNKIGIHIFNARDNFIGPDPGLCPYDGSCDPLAYGNYIGNNTGAGILYEGDGSIDNNVRGNVIGGGPGFTLNSLAPNGSDGITYKSNNPTSIESNVIAGNQGDGVHVAGHRSFTLEDNYIGANQGDGIQVAGNEGPRPDPKLRNGTGRPEGGAVARMIGNLVGQIKIGNAAVSAGNAINGIELINAVNTTIGTSTSGVRTAVTSNGTHGIKITGGNTSNVKISQSTVGTDPAGTTGLGNGGDGIRIDGAPNVVVGGNAEGNTVAGNTGDGVAVENSYGTVIVGNSIGVVPLQTSVRLANQKNGVSIKNSSGGFLGGLSSQLGNTISGNLKSGVLITGVNASVNQILRNVLGTDAFNTTGLGNDEHGVRISGGAHNNVIGGDVPDNANTISGNGGSGIFVDDDAPARGRGRSVVESTKANKFIKNNIFGNAGLGIDIFPVGGNPNDAADADEGPNRGQNYPVIDNFLINSNGDLIVAYTLDSDPANANYGSAGIEIEFFVADANGQGARLIGTDQWMLSDVGGGLKGINLGNAAGIGFFPGDALTASATDADGNTSEFIATSFAPSPTPTASSTATPEAVISGAVTYGNAIDVPAVRFVPNVLVSAAGTTISLSTSTGANGDYSLSGFGSGSYTITPTKTDGQNNAISSYDAALVAQHVIGPPFPHLSGNQLLIADVSGNGEITSFDAAEIAHYVVSNTPVGRSGTWTFNPASNFHSSVNSSITGEDYSAFLFGDVSGNWNDPVSLPRAGSTMRGAPERDIAVTVPHIVVGANTDLIIPVEVDRVANKGIIAYEFDLRYDPQVIMPQTNPVDLNNTISRSLTLVTNTSEKGLLRVAVYGPIPIRENGILLNLRFTVIGTAGSTSSLIWQRIMFNEGYIGAITIDGQVELSELNQF